MQRQPMGFGAHLYCQAGRAATCEIGAEISCLTHPTCAALLDLAPGTMPTWPKRKTR
jgi:hypothetical protein